jgi:hypothetical protein
MTIFATSLDLELMLFSDPDQAPLKQITLDPGGCGFGSTTLHLLDLLVKTLKTWFLPDIGAP